MAVIQGGMVIEGSIPRGQIVKPSGIEWYVDPVSGADTKDGQSWETAFATIAAAVTAATANDGDTVYVAEGATFNAAAAITLSKAGVRYVGLGQGNTRPAVTVTGTVDGLDLTADDVVLENFRFPTPSAVATAAVNIAAARAVLRRCGFVQGANSRDAITVTAAGELPTFEECDVLVSADGPDSWIKIEGVIDRPILRNNTIVGSDGTNAYDDGVVNFGSAAVTNPVMRDNVLLGGGVAVTVVANGGSVVGGSYGPNIYGGSAVNADNVSAESELADALYGGGGIASYPAAAAPANGVSVAEVLRDIWDALRNGAGGTEPGTNRSLLDELRGASLNYSGKNYTAVAGDFTSGVWNTVATHELFTVTGMVRMRVIAECTGTLTDAADLATIQLGVEGATDAWIGATNAAGAGGVTISAGELWFDTSPTETNANFSSACLDKIVAGGLDVGYEIAGAALTGGTIVFHCWWEPLNATGNVVAGAGGTL